MKKVRISNPNKQSEKYVSIIRYFSFDGEEYLVYYDPEEPISSTNRINVYVTKLRNHISVTILDSEWNGILNYLKMIGYSKRENKPMEIQDLNTNSLKETIITTHKILTLNYDNLEYFVKEDPDDTSTLTSLKEAKRIPREEINQRNYELMYQEELQENKRLKRKIEDLENLTLTYELNFKQIQEILKEQKAKQ